MLFLSTLGVRNKRTELTRNHGIMRNSCLYKLSQSIPMFTLNYLIISQVLMFKCSSLFSINISKAMKSILELINLCSTTFISILKISNCKGKISIIELLRSKVPWRTQKENAVCFRQVDHLPFQA